MNFTADRQAVAWGTAIRFRLRENGEILSRGEYLDRLIGSAELRDYVSALLLGEEFEDFLWETPPLTQANLDRAFEMVIIDTPTRYTSADPDTFRDFFDPGGGDQGVVSFPNLGADALMVVPSPPEPGVDYNCLAAFLRNAPPAQVQALWRTAAQCARGRLGDRPLWLSAAGGGVAWVHLRLDSRPKYYQHGAYRSELA